MNAEHSPTPWRQGVLLLTARTRAWSDQARELGRLEEAREVFSNFHAADEGRSRVFVCRCEQPDDAALIVRAVNSHDALVAALKVLISRLNTHTCHYHGPMVCDICTECNQARAALALAAGKKNEEGSR